MTLRDYKSNILNPFLLDPSANRKGKEKIENKECEDVRVNGCTCNKASIKWFEYMWKYKELGATSLWHVLNQSRINSEDTSVTFKYYLSSEDSDDLLNRIQNELFSVTGIGTPFLFHEKGNQASRSIIVDQLQKLQCHVHGQADCLSCMSPTEGLTRRQGPQKTKITSNWHRESKKWSMCGSQIMSKWIVVQDF